MMNYPDYLSHIKSIEIDKHIFRSKRGSEENVKNKIIVPLLLTLGWDLLNDIDFECMGADIVLFVENNPSLIVETKSWGEIITDHLYQCLEYTFKLNIPWILITSGQHTAMFSSLINNENLLDSDPIIRFSFEELLGSNGPKLLEELSSLIGKKAFVKGHSELSAIVTERLGDRDISEAKRDFMDKASKYKSEIKSKRLTLDEFMSLAENHSDEVRDAIIHIYRKMLELTELSDELRIRYRSREIGLEHHLTAHPRDKIIGLFGIYPESAHIALGLEGWERLNISEKTFKELRSYPRKVESRVWSETLSDLLRIAIQEINA